MNLYELRFNLVKNGLISSLFCSKLAKFKIESYLSEFLNTFKSSNNPQTNSADLQILLDILFFFYRKHNQVMIQIPNGNDKSNENLGKNIGTDEILSSNNDPYEDASFMSVTENETKIVDLIKEEDDECDRMLYIDLAVWIKSISTLFLNHTDLYRQNTNQSSFTTASLLHFDNCYFMIEHLLRVPNCNQFAYLFQYPIISIDTMIEKQKIELNSSKSDPIINLYFDGYLRLLAPFSRTIKKRDAFMFMNSSRIESLKSHMNKQSDKAWQFIDLEGTFY